MSAVRAGAETHIKPRGELRAFIVPRLSTFALTLFVVLTLNFLLPRAMPGDPIAGLADPDNSFFVSDNSTREALMSYYGLDQPLLVQYGEYLKGLATGDLGWSISYHAPVSEIILSHLPWTLLLVIPSLLIATLISLIAGANAGWRRGTRADRALIVVMSTVRTIPVFFLGTLAILFFSVRLGWFPLSGARTPFAEHANQWTALIDILKYWTLPVAVLTIEMVGGQFLLLRNSMVTVLGEDFMLVARAKGLSERRLKYRHALRNAILPFFTLFSIQLGLVVTGTIFIETLFSYPGMGLLMFDAVGARDYPLLQGGFLIVSVSVLTANLLADLTYARLDPRVRMS